MKPVEPRDHSRLMVVRRDGAIVDHRRFHEVGNFLQSGDVLVLNKTRVMPVRLKGIVEKTGRSVEVLLVREQAPGRWEVLISSLKHVQDGSTVMFGEGWRGKFRGVEAGIQVMDFADPDQVRPGYIRQGLMPLPPYILKRRQHALENGWKDAEWYQTVYAEEEGAIAAPTAGLHFTSAVLDDLRQRGVIITFITLHVGPGTFLPVRSEEVGDHKMLPEKASVSDGVVEQIVEAKKRGRRVVAVGTTVVRTLETAARDGELKSYEGETDLFVTPGFSFRVVDGLMTNFHLPKSTPLILVSAFAGREHALKWYQEAQSLDYRWLSYGDAMLILSEAS